MGYAIDDGLVLHHSIRTVNIAGAAYVAVSIAYFVLTRLQTLQVSGIGESFLNDLRRRVFSHLLSQPLAFFEAESSGQLLSRMTADIDTLESLVQSGLSSFVTSIGLFVASLIVLVVMSPLMCAVVVVSLVPTLIASARYRTASTRAYRLVRDLIGGALASLDEDLAGVRVVQAFRQEEATIERFREVNQVQLEGELATVHLSSRFFPKIELSGVSSTVIVLVVGALLVQAHLTTVGIIAAFVLYLANLFNAITSLSALFDLLQSSGAAMATVFGLLEVGPAMVDPERPSPLPRRGSLELESVHFAYGVGADDDLGPRSSMSAWCWKEWTYGSRRGSGWPWSAPLVGASPPWPSWPVACTTPHRGRSVSVEWTCARPCCPTSGSGSSCCPKRASCSGARCSRT